MSLRPVVIEPTVFTGSNTAPSRPDTIRVPHAFASHHRTHNNSSSTMSGGGGGVSRGPLRGDSSVSHSQSNNSSFQPSRSTGERSITASGVRTTSPTYRHNPYLSSPASEVCFLVASPTSVETESAEPLPLAHPQPPHHHDDAQPSGGVDVTSNRRLVVRSRSRRDQSMSARSVSEGHSYGGGASTASAAGIPHLPMDPTTGGHDSTHGGGGTLRRRDSTASLSCGDNSYSAALYSCADSSFVSSHGSPIGHQLTTLVHAPAAPQASGPYARRRTGSNSASWHSHPQTPHSRGSPATSSMYYSATNFANAAAAAPGTGTGGNGNGNSMSNNPYVGVRLTPESPAGQALGVEGGDGQGRAASQQQQQRSPQGWLQGVSPAAVSIPAVPPVNAQAVSHVHPHHAHHSYHHQQQHGRDGSGVGTESSGDFTSATIDGQPAAHATRVYRGASSRSTSPQSSPGVVVLNAGGSFRSVPSPYASPNSAAGEGVRMPHARLGGTPPIYNQPSSAPLSPDTECMIVPGAVDGGTSTAGIGGAMPIARHQQQPADSDANANAAAGQAEVLSDHPSWTQFRSFGSGGGSTSSHHHPHSSASQSAEGDSGPATAARFNTRGPGDDARRTTMIHRDTVDGLVAAAAAAAAGGKDQQSFLSASSASTFGATRTAGALPDMLSANVSDGAAAAAAAEGETTHAAHGANVINGTAGASAASAAGNAAAGGSIDKAHTSPSLQQTLSPKDTAELQATASAKKPAKPAVPVDMTSDGEAAEDNNAHHHPHNNNDDDDDDDDASSEGKKGKNKKKKRARRSRKVKFLEDLPPPTEMKFLPPPPPPLPAGFESAAVDATAALNTTAAQIASMRPDHSFDKFYSVLLRWYERILADEGDFVSVPLTPATTATATPAATHGTMLTATSLASLEASHATLHNSGLLPTSGNYTPYSGAVGTVGGGGVTSPNSTPSSAVFALTNFHGSSATVNGATAAGGGAASSAAAPPTRRTPSGNEVPVVCPRIELYMPLSDIPLSLLSGGGVTAKQPTTTNATTTAAAAASAAAQAASAESRKYSLVSNTFAADQSSLKSSVAEVALKKTSGGVGPAAAAADCVVAAPLSPIPTAAAGADVVRVHHVGKAVQWAKAVMSWWLSYVHPHSFNSRHQLAPQTVLAVGAAGAPPLSMPPPLSQQQQPQQYYDPQQYQQQYQQQQYQQQQQSNMGSVYGWNASAMAMPGYSSHPHAYTGSVPPAPQTAAGGMRLQNSYPQQQQQQQQAQSYSYPQQYSQQQYGQQTMSQAAQSSGYDGVSMAAYQQQQYAQSAYQNYAMTPPQQHPQQVTMANGYSMYRSY